MRRGVDRRVCSSWQTTDETAACGRGTGGETAGVGGRGLLVTNSDGLASDALVKRTPQPIRMRLLPLDALLTSPTTDPRRCLLTQPLLGKHSTTFEAVAFSRRGIGTGTGTGIACTTRSFWQS